MSLEGLAREWWWGETSVRGLLHHITFSPRVYSGCSQAPVVYGIYCLKGEPGTQEKSAGQLGIKSDAGPALAPPWGD